MQPPRLTHHILYVDDEPSNLSVFKSSFRRKYQIHIAESGQEALKILEKEDIDLIITDHRMPLMTGVELLRIAKERYPDVIRIILTGYSDTDAVIAAVNECNIFRYLTKPWNPEDMENALNTALETQSLREENKRLVQELKNFNASLEERVQEQVQILKSQKSEMASLNSNLQRSNRELQKSELRYRAIGENMPNGFVLTISPSLTYTFIGGQELEERDITPQDLIGKPLNEVHDVYASSKVTHYYQKALMGEPEDFEVQMWGQVYSISCIPFPYHEGQAVEGVLAVGQNITKKKREQTALQHGRDFLSKLFNTVPCLLYLFDLHHMKATYVNEWVAQALGYQAAHFMQLSEQGWKTHMPTEDWKRLQEHFQKAKLLKDQEVGSIEYRLKHKNGHLVWLRSTTTVFERDANGQAITTLSYVEEISKHKLAEAQLKENSNFLEQINKLSSNLIFILEYPSLRLTYHNQQVEQMFGLSKSIIRQLGSDFFSSVVHPDDLSNLKGHFRETALASDAAHKKSVTYRMKNAAGNWRWMLDNSVIFRKGDPSSESVQVLGMAQDITELKEVEIHLQQSEERLLETQRLTKVGRWEIDVPNNKVQWFGLDFSIADHMPKGLDSRLLSSYVQLMLPEDVPLFLSNQEQLIHEQLPYEMDIRYRLNNGKVAYLHLKARPVINKGEVVKIIGSAMDITRIKAFEQKLRKLNASKDRILATVAHDLRNPINSIQGLTTILKLELGSVSDHISEYFDRIEDSCHKGLALITELLEISELENEDFELETEPTAIDEFISSVIGNNEHYFEKSSIMLVKELNCGGFYSALNQDKFRRVIENLLGNALKFTPEKGMVSIITEQTSEYRLQITISDTGIGIPSELQPTLFDKFSKSGRTGLKGQKSTGLGMSIVKNIIELHGGHIRFESAEEQGTSFFIELPILSS